MSFLLSRGGRIFSFLSSFLKISNANLTKHVESWLAVVVYSFITVFI